MGFFNKDKANKAKAEAEAKENPEAKAPEASRAETDAKDEAQKESQAAPQEDLKAALEREKANVENLKSQLAAAEKAKEDAFNRYYQELADVQNLRKEIARDNESLLKYAGEPFVRSIVPFLNSMDQSFKFVPKDCPNAEGWIKGIQLAYKQLMKALAGNGVTMIAPKAGDKFDPREMEAIQTVEGDEADKIASVFMAGYKLKDRLIAPASVVVTVAKPKAQAPKAEAAADAHDGEVKVTGEDDVEKSRADATKKAN